MRDGDSEDARTHVCVCVCVHSDITLSILGQGASQDERDVLEAIPYTVNDIYLHTGTFTQVPVNPTGHRHISTCTPWLALVFRTVADPETERGLRVYARASPMAPAHTFVREREGVRVHICLRARVYVCVCYTDPALMPKDRKVWASWNFLGTSGAEQDTAAVCVSYWANRLQHLPQGAPDIFVTLNPPKPPGKGERRHAHMFWQGVVPQR